MKKIFVVLLAGLLVFSTFLLVVRLGNAFSNGDEEGELTDTETTDTPETPETPETPLHTLSYKNGDFTPSYLYESVGGTTRVFFGLYCDKLNAETTYKLSWKFDPAFLEELTSKGFEWIFPEQLESGEQCIEYRVLDADTLIHSDLFTAEGYETLLENNVIVNTSGGNRLEMLAFYLTSTNTQDFTATVDFLKQFVIDVELVEMRDLIVSDTEAVAS